MNVVNYSEFRNNLKAHLDIVTQNHETLIISRGKNDNAVLISLNDYNKFLETSHLVSSEKNKKRLMESIDRAKLGVSEFHDLVEVAGLE